MHIVRSFTQTQVNAVILPRIGRRPLPSLSFPNLYSLIILPRNALCGTIPMFVIETITNIGMYVQCKTSLLTRTYEISVTITVRVTVSVTVSVTVTVTVTWAQEASLIIFNKRRTSVSVKYPDLSYYRNSLLLCPAPNRSASRNEGHSWSW